MTKKHCYLQTKGFGGGARGHCTTTIINWDELVAHEPRLNDLLIEARSIKDEGGSYFCKHEAWALGWQGHAAFRKSIHRLVGYGCCRDSFLATSQAWDVVLEKLLEVLPPCRACCCITPTGGYT